MKLPYIKISPTLTVVVDGHPNDGEWTYCAGKVFKATAIQLPSFQKIISTIGDKLGDLPQVEVVDEVEELALKMIPQTFNENEEGDLDEGKLYHKRAGFILGYNFNLAKWTDEEVILYGDFITEYYKWNDKPYKSKEELLKSFVISLKKQFIELETKEVQIWDIEGGSVSVIKTQLKILSTEK